MKAGLPQDGVVEKTLDENHFRIAPHLFPCIQTALGAWQKPVGWRCGRDATAIEIVFQWKDDAMDVSVIAERGDQTGLTQSGERVAQLCQPTPQATAGRVTNSHYL